MWRRARRVRPLMPVPAKFSTQRRLDRKVSPLWSAKPVAECPSTECLPSTPVRPLAICNFALLLWPPHCARERQTHAVARASSVALRAEGQDRAAPVARICLTSLCRTHRRIAEYSRRGNPLRQGVGQGGGHRSPRATGFHRCRRHRRDGPWFCSEHLALRPERLAPRADCPDQRRSGRPRDRAGGPCGPARMDRAAPRAVSGQSNNAVE